MLRTPSSRPRTFSVTKSPPCTASLPHLIQILTPEQPEPEGPSLRELLASVIRDQSEAAALLKQTLAATARIETRLGGAETTHAAPTLS